MLSITFFLLRIKKSGQ
ncbi:MAG: hypothetical protein EOO05_18995 [Chitinophagaceae bacterium]|nr:MAG: hypothetical protein EOO05_18995 [Chitinophagaceae bacterium]